MLYRIWDGDIQGHTGQPSVGEINAHTMYNQWATAPGRSLNYPRPKSITHLRTFSNNGVYVALQLFLVILVSDQWRRILSDTLLLSTGALGYFTCSGMTLPIYMGPTALRGIRATGDTLSNVESQVFTPYNFGSSRDWTPDIPGQRVTFRPRLSIRPLQVQLEVLIFAHSL